MITSSCTREKISDKEDVLQQGSDASSKNILTFHDQILLMCKLIYLWIGLFLSEVGISISNSKRISISVLIVYISCICTYSYLKES